MALFYYQGAKGDRGMTGEVGEKGEQVKTECAFQQCCQCDCSFISNSYVACTRAPFSEAEQEDGSSLSLASYAEEWNQSNPPQASILISNKKPPSTICFLTSRLNALNSLRNLTLTYFLG